jgi:hypothetical protein
MKQKVAALSVAVLVLSFFITPQSSVAATLTAPTANQTVANVSVGATDNQSAATTPTTPNTAEVKATRTLTVGALPANAETVVIGACTVTFTTVASSTTHDTNCSGGASIDRTAGTGDVNLTPTEIATQLAALTGLTDTGHSGLTASASSTSVTSAVFTTTGTEASATAITFTDGTSGDITSVASVTGVIPVAQVNTITITGTVETGDVFTATLPTVGAVTYTVLSSDTTTTNIATGLGAAITASAGYGSQAFTIATSTNTVVFTAKVAGTGFTQTSTATNYAGVAQVVVFTPVDVNEDYTYGISINGTEYTYRLTSDDLVELVEGLELSVDGSADVTCTENDATITCTSATAGTAFTYATSVDEPHGGSKSSRRSGGGGSSSSHAATVKPTTPASSSASPVAFLATTGGVSSIARTLSFGMSGADITLIQQLLAKDVAVYPEGRVTGYFGALTKAAVERFQVKYAITKAGVPGYGWVGPRTKAKMMEIFGK